jgi:diacylglycerol O-acyltransferase
VTSAIRRYAELHGVPVKGRLLRIIVPVSVRGKGDVTDLGNRITFLPLTIPLDIRNPIELIAAIRERLAFLKNVHVAELVSLAGTLLGTIPPPAQALAGPIASQLPLSLCNTICTNVPGPKVPLYLIGHRMLACYPYVATSSDLGMNCAILTYNGTAYFGFTGDVHAMPDVERLGKFLRMSFAELRKAVAIRAARSDRARSIPASRASRVR